MKLLLSLLFPLWAMACPQYELIKTITSAYEDPSPANIRAARISAIERFGYHPEFAHKWKAKLSAAFFETEIFKLRLHSAAAASLNCLKEKIKECGHADEFLPFTDHLLGLHKLKLGLRLPKSNECVKDLLQKNGFYPLDEESFIFLGEEKKDGTQKCPFNMAHLESSRSCIDKFEAPNIEGLKPFVARTANEAIAYCQMQGKELCSDETWQAACENETSKTPFPYGREYKRGVCNDDKRWMPPDWYLINRYNPNHPHIDPLAREHTLSLDQSVPSGSKSGCTTGKGVYDLTGNAAEWVLNTRRRPSTTDGRIYPTVMKGCYWAKCLKGINPSCAFTNSNHSAHFRSYEAGFRCCGKDLSHGLPRSTSGRD